MIILSGFKTGFAMVDFIRGITGIPDETIESCRV